MRNFPGPVHSLKMFKYTRKKNGIFSPTVIPGCSSYVTPKVAKFVASRDLGFIRRTPPSRGGTAAAAPPPFRLGTPPLVTQYCCRLGDLLRFVFICVLIVFFSVNCVFCVFLQYFDTVGWVFWPVKTVARITYTVLELGRDVKPCSINQKSPSRPSKTGLNYIRTTNLMCT